MSNQEEIKEKLLEYVITILEEKREEFSGFSVCPFVKADRIKNQLFLDVFDNQKETLVDVILRFVRSKKSSALIAQLNTDIAGTETRGYQNFVNLVIEECKLGNVKALCFNPNDQLEVEGYNARSKAPYFLINMAYTDDLSKAHRSLKQTKYYDKIPHDYTSYLGVKK
jgi:hypothetical protein